MAWAQWQWTQHRLPAGLPWMLAGILLAAIGTILFRTSSPETAGGPRAAPQLSSEALFLVAVTLAAGLIRFVALDHLPPGGFFDEVQDHLVAEGILHGDRPVFIADYTQMPALFFYFLAGAIKVMGRGLTTVRGVSALFGTLTIPAFYLIARRTFVWPVAAATTILLAASRWHVTFSRVGFVTIVGPFFELLAIWCLWRGMESRKTVFYVLLGIVTGIGLQCYYSFNLFPAVLAVAAVSFAFRNGWRRFGQELLPIVRGLALAVLITVVLMIPIIRFAVKNPQVFFQRSSTVAIWNPAHHLPWPGILWQNIETHLLMFQFRGDANPRHNIAEVPILN